MSWTDFFTNLRRYDENAAVIFDQEEPIGRPTDLVMPRRRWFKRAKREAVSSDWKGAARES